jgi:hypothetical protein
MVRPRTSASSVSTTLPAWLATPSPSAVTTNRARRLVVGFIVEALSLDGCWDVLQRQYPISGEPFLLFPSRVSYSRTY